MRYDLAEGPCPVTRRFDVCIIGAGAAGITLAVLLTRAGKQVVLIESGGQNPEPATQDLYRSHVTGQRHTGVHDGRFRVWGGTTTRWGGQILELEPIDFAYRPWIEGSGWPVSRDELNADYKAALALEGLSGAIQEDRSVWAAAGSPEPQLGPTLEPYVTRWCPQPNFARLHAAELDRADTLSVISHANLVDFASECSHKVAKSTVQGVQHATFKSLNGHICTVVANEFVLCVGTIETSRILLNLAERHGQHWNPNGLVGCHFQDHIDCEIATLRPLDSRGFTAAFTNILVRGFKYHPKFRLSPAEQERQVTLNVAGTFVFHDSTAEAADAIKATGKRLLRRAWTELDRAQLINLVWHTPSLLRQAWAYLVKHRVYNSPNAALTLRVHCEQEPTGASCIRLSEERDALGLLRVQLEWVISERELHTVRRFAKTSAQALRTAGLAEVEPFPDLDDDAALRARCDDGLHHIGGAVMSADPGQGVVDTELRLYGMPNLSICSASVFPTGGFSNPTHTVLALAVRLARRLAAA